jgi:hypothetical protein
MITTYEKDFFSWKQNGPNSSYFKEKKIPNSQILMISSRR